MSGSDIDPEAIAEFAKRLSQMASVRYTMRPFGEVARFFDGLELVAPGIVQVHRWRPDPDADTSHEFAMYCGVARKP